MYYLYTRAVNNKGKYEFLLSTGPKNRSGERYLTYSELILHMFSIDVMLERGEKIFEINRRNGFIEFKGGWRSDEEIYEYYISNRPLKAKDIKNDEEI
jgi:hypothetical protein